jgi:heme/copper-type cytochrome/quinol oxidase subunit 1
LFTPTQNCSPQPCASSNAHVLPGHVVRLPTDHKRIALLYLLSITFFLFIGGFFALLIRLELLTPAGDLVQADTYNKLFTMHGMVMVFFFLIPSIPAVLGNFLVPMMIGAKDLAFPRINLLSWYLYIIGGMMIPLHCMLTGGFRQNSARQQLTYTIAVSCFWLGMVIHRFCDPSVCPAGPNPIRM